MAEVFEELRSQAKAKRDQAKALEAEARALCEQADKVQAATTTVESRLTYAAFARCPCGAGMAYDPVGESGKPFGGYWDCSAILLGVADKSVKHSAQLPFAFYEIKSDQQPSAGGATTRPKQPDPTTPAGA
jgi:hypothetical protein